MSFRWKDYRAKGRTRHKTMTLSADEFMRRFLLHVLPTGFLRIRHYGLLANVGRREYLARVRDLLDVPPPEPPKEARSETPRPTFVCRCCGAVLRVVEVFPRRGMFVTTVEFRDLASLCEVRTVLEIYGARLAAERASETERQELAGLVAELDRPEAHDQRALMAFDRRIHQAIYRCAHNEFLARTLEEYYVLALRIWHLALDQASGLEAAVQQHRPLLEAIRTGSGDDAAEIMRRHVDDFERAMRRVMLGA